MVCLVMRNIIFLQNKNLFWREIPVFHQNYFDPVNWPIDEGAVEKVYYLYYYRLYFATQLQALKFASNDVYWFIRIAKHLRSIYYEVVMTMWAT